MFIEQFIVRAAMSAGQKTAAKIAAKIATSTVSSLVSMQAYSNIAKKESVKLQASNDLSEKNVKKHQTNAAIKGGAFSGLSAGVGLVAYTQLAKIIDNS